MNTVAGQVSKRFWVVSSISLLLLGAGCSGADSPTKTTSRSASATTPASPYTGYPDSVAAIGHSAVTGEGTQPGGQEDKANSWATGTNPEVNSIYLRILHSHPAIEGHAINFGTGSADVESLAGQAQGLIAEDPQPELVLIATLDADITCPATQRDFAAYGEALGKVLEELSTKMPGSRFFITTQISTPSRDAAVYSRQERATVGGAGPCAFLDPEGNVVPKELKRLEAAIAGFKTQLTKACSETDRCSTDQTGQGWSMRRSDYSDDLNHLNLSGQSRWAEYVWGLLQKAQLVPTQ
jgi:hypothetical protein